MPYPVHNKFVVRGVFASTKEIWSNSLHFESTFGGGSDNTPSDWDGSAVTAAVNAFYGGTACSGSAKVTGWRGYQIGADGKTVSGSKRIEEYASPVPGASSTRYPPQVSLVVTLVGADDGPGHFGRIFLPSPGKALVDSTQEIASGSADEVLADFKTYVEALKDAMYDASFVGESLLNVSKVGSGAKQDVVSYKCGLALDTIRTRRNKLLENYQTLAA